MSKKLLMLCTAVLSLAFIGSSFAGVENIQVSGDITAQAINRDVSMGSDAVGGTGDNGDNFIASQTKLRFDADLTENVGAVIGLINERIWSEETTNRSENTEIDLDLAYVELKEFLYQPLTLVVGRQNLRYGSGLIVGDPDTNQTANTAKAPLEVADLSLRKAFDAVRAVFDYAPYTLDLIYAKVDEANAKLDDDVSLFGANLAYEWDSYNGLTELYFFGSDNSRTNSTLNDDDQRKTYVIGARAQMDTDDHITLSGEAAYQFGDAFADTNNDQTNDDYRHLKAWAGLISANYKFLNDYNAKVGASYTYLSGNDVDHDNYGAWDPMYEDTTAGELINILSPASNCHLINLCGSYMPQEDVTLGLSYVAAFQAEKLGDGVTTYDIALGPATTGAGDYNIRQDNRFFGQEVDMYAFYDYTEDVQLKLNSALFLPGNFFDESNDKPAYSIRGGLSVNF